MTYIFNIIDFYSLNHLESLLNYVSLTTLIIKDVGVKPILSIGVVILIPLILLSSGKIMKEVLDAAAKIVTIAAGGIVVGESIEKRLSNSEKKILLMKQKNQEQVAMKAVKVVMQTKFVIMFIPNKYKSIILFFNQIRL